MQLRCLSIRVPLVPEAGLYLIHITFFPCKQALPGRKVFIDYG